MSVSNEQVLLTEMLEYQDQLNTLVRGTNWLNDDAILSYRAIYQEATEGVEHLGWKWWKGQSSDIPQARMEAIDIFHFVLMDALIVNKEMANNPRRYSMIAQDLLGDDTLEYIDGENTTINNFNYPELDQKVVVNMEDPRDIFELMSFYALSARFTSLDHYCVPFQLLIDLCRAFDMELVDVYDFYVAKNALNIFRQKKGYKIKGKYIKDGWPNPNYPEAGSEYLEDNEYLEMLINEFKVDGKLPSNSMPRIQAQLEHYYESQVLTL